MPVAEKRLLEHADYLRALVRGLLADPGRVDDVVQETYLRALTNPPRHSHNLRGWLATVARNLAFRTQRDASRDVRRNARREERAGRPDCQPPTSDVAARVEAQQRIAAAVSELDEPYRGAIVHRYLDGMKPAEIARRTGVPVKTVKTHLERGLARLRARLDSEYGDRQRWSMLLLPLALPKGGATVAAGVTLITMKKIVAALVLLCVAVFFVVKGAAGDRDTEAAAPRAERDVEQSSAASVKQEPATPTEPEPTAAAAFVFSGRVSDSKGSGVAGARVRLVYWSWPKAEQFQSGGDRILRRERERIENPHTVADGGGYFRFERPYASQSYLEVDAPKFGAVVAGPFEPKDDLEIVLDPELGLRVTVQDPEGKPVPDAEVRIMPISINHAWSSRNAVARGRTNESGQVDLPRIASDTLLLEVAPSDPELGFVELRLGDAVAHKVTVPRVKLRFHRIVDAVTGDPITDAYALVSFSGYQMHSIEQERVRRRIDADLEGVIRFPVQENYYGHLITAPGYEITSLARDIVPLQRSMVIDGTVLDVEGRPVADVPILLATSEGVSFRRFASLSLAAAWTDAEGRFRAEVKLLWPHQGAPDPGDRSIVAIDPRHGCAIVDSIPVKPGTRRTVTLRFAEPATLTIEVVGPEGAPRTDQWMNVLRRVPRPESWSKMYKGYGINTPWLFGQRLVPDAQGRMVVGNLPAGDYDVHIKHLRREFELVAGENKVLRVVMGAGASISGRLLGPDGNPIGQQMVRINGPTNALGHTDAEGRFIFEDVKPGKHQVGFRSFRANSWISVEAVPGQDVTLREPKELTRLRIVVEGPDAGTAEYAYTTSKGSAYPHSGFTSVTAEATPEFEPSKGIVIVRAPGYGWKVVRFEAHAGAPTVVRVAMERAGSLRGTASGGKQMYVFTHRPDGYPDNLVKGDQNLTHGLQRCLGNERFSTKVKKGRYEIAELAPGRYEVSLYDRVEGRLVALTKPQEVVIRSGVAQELSFAR